MKIAMVINTSWNIYNFRKGLVDHLKKEGHEMILIAPKDKYSSAIAGWGQYHAVSMDNTGSNPLKDLILCWNLFKLYKNYKPDVILHFTIKPNIYGSLAARALNIPVINNVSGLGTIFIQTTLSTSVAKTLYRLAFRGRQHVFFQNADDQRDFNEHIPLRVGQSIIPGSGIDLVRLSYTEPEEKTEKVFLMIARLLIDKGVEEYLMAAKEIKKRFSNTRFLLAGGLDEGHARAISGQTLQEYVDEGVIEYMGHVHPVYDLIEKADWVVLPSYREGTPRTLLEAAALGRPLVATDVPGCREVVEHGINGFLCVERDFRSLSEQLQKAVQLDHRKTVGMGKKSRMLVERKFDEMIVFNSYSKQIRS